MRTIRQNIEGVVYHLIWRFVDRRFLLTGDEERSFYLKLLGRALAESDWRCLAYALMSTHIHLAMIAGRQRLASWAIRVHSPFVGWMNERLDRLGPMFARGPKDFAIYPGNEGQLLAYIHNNPVRAGVVTHARDSRWTSHAAYIGLETSPAWLHRREGLALAGLSAEQFDAWVERTPGDGGQVSLGRVAAAARKHGAIEVATPMAGEETNVIPLVARPGTFVRPNPRRIVVLAAQCLGLTEGELCSRRRGPLVVGARRVAVHCARTIGIANCDIAAALALSATAVSRIALRPLEGQLMPVLGAVMARLRDEGAA